MSEVSRITLAAPDAEEEVIVNTTNRTLALRTALAKFPEIAENVHYISLSIMERPVIQNHRYWKVIDGEEIEINESHDPVIEPIEE